MAQKADKSTDRRGQIWINSRVQSYLMIHGALFGAFFLVIFGIIEFYFIERFKVGLDAAGLTANDQLVQYFFEYQWVKVLMIIAFSVVVLLISLLQMLYVSHRICGPIYKMTQWLEQKREHPDSSGELRFRKRDYFEEVAESMNELFNEYDLVPKQKKEK